MTKSLETADHILKLGLACAVVIGYGFRVIIGPFATALFILALMVLAFFLVQAIVVKFVIRD